MLTAVFISASRPSAILVSLTTKSETFKLIFTIAIYSSSTQKLISRITKFFLILELIDTTTNFIMLRIFKCFDKCSIDITVFIMYLHIIHDNIKQFQRYFYLVSTHR